MPSPNTTPYLQSLLEALKVPNPDDLPPGVLCRVLYAPSFHPEALVEVGTGAIGDWATFTTLLTNWNTWQYYGILSPRWTPHQAAQTPRPVWYQARSLLTSPILHHFVDAMPDRLGEQPKSDYITLDGMPVYVWLRAHCRGVEYGTYNPQDEHPLAARVGDAVLELSLAAFTDAISQAILVCISQYGRERTPDTLWRELRFAVDIRQYIRNKPNQ